MSHYRVGHIQFPQPEPISKNAPTNAAMPVEDERVTQLRAYLDGLTRDAHASAINPSLAPDVRSQNLGAYLALNAARNRLTSLFKHEVTLPSTTSEPQEN